MLNPRYDGDDMMVKPGRAWVVGGRLFDRVCRAVRARSRVLTER